MRKIFCFIFGISFASFGMKPPHDPPSEVQELIDSFHKVSTCLQTRKNSDPKFRENNVLLVGSTGTGKDSLLYYFKNITLNITRSRTIEASTPLEGVCIGHAGSETIIPASVVVDDITYWSCPGFGDTRGPKQELINTFAISNILCGNIKIVIVIGEGSINADRQQGTFECLRNVKNILLPNVSKDLSQHLGVIVTCGEYQSCKNTIEDLLERVRNNMNDFKEYSDVAKTVEYLIENRIAYFPKPSSRSGEYPTSFRNDILRMIQEIPDYLKLENDTVKMVIDDKTKSLLRDMHTALLAQTNDILEKHLFKYISTLLYKKFGNFFTASNPIAFTDKIKKIKEKTDKAINSLGQIHIDNILEFFVDILDDNNDTLAYLEKIKRINTYIKFICQYYDTPFVIEKWITGLHRLDQQLSKLLLQMEVQKLIDSFHEVSTCLQSRKNSDPKFRENNVLLVGSTGTGKDSLLYYFKNITLNITRSRTIEASTTLEGVCIGHAGSETIIPASVVVDDITYWSCPGFGDTRGPKQELINTFAINNILHGNIKIVIVIQDAGIKSGRQEKIFECVNTIKNNLLPNVSKDLSRHLGLIVTCGASPSSSQNTIQQLLAKINRKDFNRDYTDAVGTVKSLIENKRIAYFPKPSSREGMYPSNFRDDILKMIKEIPDYLKLENNTIKMHIKEGPEVLLREMLEELLAQTNNILEKHLFESIKILLDNFRTEFSIPKEITKKIDGLMGNPEQVFFADKIREIKTKMNAVDNSSKGHVLLDSIHNFFMDILHDNSDAVTHLEQIKRISTYIEFVCKYCDDPFVIDQWMTGSERLKQQLSECEDYILKEQVKATLVAATAAGVVVGCTAGGPDARQAIAGSATGDDVASGLAAVGAGVIADISQRTHSMI